MWAWDLHSPPSYPFFRSLKPQLKRVGTQTQLVDEKNKMKSKMFFLLYLTVSCPCTENTNCFVWLLQFFCPSFVIFLLTVFTGNQQSPLSMNAISSVFRFFFFFFMELKVLVCNTYHCLQVQDLLLLMQMNWSVSSLQGTFFSMNRKTLLCGLPCPFF